MKRFDYRSFCTLEVDTMIVQNEMYMRVTWIQAMYYPNSMEKHVEECYEWYYADFILLNDKDLHKVTGQDQKAELEKWYQERKRPAKTEICKN